MVKPFTGYLDQRPMRAYKQSVWERVTSLLPKKAPAQGLISGLDQTQLALGIDTSHWCGPLPRELVEGADWVSPKATDGGQMQTGSWGDLGTFIDDQFHATVQLDYEVGRPTIPYHFFQWDYDQWSREQVVVHQYNVILNAFKNLVPKVSYHGFALDLETLGDTAVNYQWKVEQLYNRLKNHPKFIDVPILFYTSNYILEQYPALRDWLSFQGADKLLWLAQWPYTKAWSGDWAAFRSQVLPTINMKVITPGFASWTAVQWSASCKICGVGVDVNSWCRTKTDLYKWLGYQPGTVEPPIDPPDTSELEERVTYLEGLTATLDAEVDGLSQRVDKIVNGLHSIEG